MICLSQGGLRSLSAPSIKCELTVCASISNSKPSITRTDASWSADRTASIAAWAVCGTVRTILVDRTHWSAEIKNKHSSHCKTYQLKERKESTQICFPYHMLIPWQFPRLNIIRFQTCNLFMQYGCFIITSLAKEVMLLVALVCSSVCLWTTLLKKVWTDWGEILWRCPG